MSNPPRREIRDGALKASIWENDGQNGKFYNATFDRAYTDKEGQTANADSFSGSQLLRLSRLAQKAYDEIQQLQKENGFRRYAAEDEHDLGE